MVCAVCSAARLSTPAPPEPLPHLYASANQLRSIIHQIYQTVDTLGSEQLAGMVLVYLPRFRIVCLLSNSLTVIGCYFPTIRDFGTLVQLYV